MRMRAIMGMDRREVLKKEDDGAIGEERIRLKRSHARLGLLEFK